MRNLLSRPTSAATVRATAARLARAAAGASLSPDEAMPAQISRRGLLQHPTAAPSETDVALREPEPDRELLSLGRYIAWRFTGMPDALRNGPPDDAARHESLMEGRPDAPPPDLRSAAALYAVLEPDVWTLGPWSGLDDDTLAGVAFQRLVSAAQLGMTVDPTLTGMYRVLRGRLSEEQRLQVLADVGFQIDPDGDQVGVLLPFLYNDPSMAVTAYAAFLWAQRVRTTHDTPMDGVRTVMRHVTDLAATERERCQAMLSGLLALGDGRALPVLDRCWRPFPENQKSLLGRSLFTPVSAAELEWTVRWMEDSSEDDLGFGAARLANAAARGGSAPLIRDLHWHLPVPRVDDPDDPTWQAPWTVLQTWRFPQYATILEPRLRRILLWETTDPVVPYVLTAWGLEVGDWDEIDQLRRIGERYLAHVEALRQRVEPPAEDEVGTWVWRQMAEAVDGERPLAGLAVLLAAMTRSAPDARWVPVDPVRASGQGEAALVRGRVDALRRILRGRFGPNLSAAQSDLALLESRWGELSLAGGF